MGRTVRSRLTSSHLLVALAGVAMTAALGSYLFSVYYVRQRQSELLQATRQIAGLAAPGLAHGDRAELWVLARTAGAAMGGPVCIFAEGEQSPYASSLTDEQDAKRPAVPLAHGEPDQTAVTTVPIACVGGLTYTATAPVLDARSGQPLGLVVVRCPISLSQRIVAAQWASAGLAACGAALLAILLAALLAQRLARPLDELSQAAAKLARGQFAVHIPVQGPMELARLGEALSLAARQLALLFAEQQAARSKLADVIASMAEGVLVYGDDQRVSLANEPAKALLGWSSESCEGVALSTLVPSLELREALLAGTDEPLAAPGGTVRLRTARLSSGGETVAVLVDVTAEQRLDRMRREFVANASHQLRTPLTSIRGYLEAISDGTAAGDAERSRCLGVALDQVSLLQRLVDQLMQLSRLQGGRLDEPPEPVDLVALARRAVAHLAPQAAARQVRVEVDTDADELLAVGQPDLLLQAAHNLLDNAIRHTPAGAPVQVGVRRAGDWLELAVSDEGPGFPPEQSEAIWERFHAGGPHGRTGLGLAIAKEIIAAHDGEVFAALRPGGGAVFGFRLPKAP